MSQRAQSPAFAPILITPRNSLAACGLPWRFVREHAAALGVTTIQLGRKRVMRADHLLAALERQHEQPTPADPVDAIRQSIGMERYSAGASEDGGKR